MNRDHGNDSGDRAREDKRWCDERDDRLAATFRDVTDALDEVARALPKPPATKGVTVNTVTEEWPDALRGGVTLRRSPDGVVDESSDNGKTWQPVYDDGPSKNCWCKFGAIRRDPTGPERATMLAGRGWERVYVCRTCRGNPKLPYVGGVQT